MPLRREKVESELQRPEAEDITPVSLLSFLSGYQDFLSYLFLTVRGKIHICLDPRPLNFALQRAKLKSYQVVGSKVKVMSLCYANEAFWMLKLDEESSKLTSFETQIGRYRWLKVARMEREKS